MDRTLGYVMQCTTELIGSNEQKHNLGCLLSQTTNFISCSTTYMYRKRAHKMENFGQIPFKNYVSNKYRDNCQFYMVTKGTHTHTIRFDL